MFCEVSIKKFLNLATNYFGLAEIVPQMIKIFYQGVIKAELTLIWQLIGARGGKKLV